MPITAGHATESERTAAFLDGSGAAWYIDRVDKPATQPWSVEFVIESDADRDSLFQAEYRRNAPTWEHHVARLQRNHRNIVRAITIVIPTAIILVLISQLYPSIDSELGNVHVVLSVVGVLLLVCAIDSSRSLRRARNPASTPPKTDRKQQAYRHTVRVSDVGVLFVESNWELLMRWNTYHDVIQLPSFVVVQCISEQSAVIPNTCFASDAAREDFITCVRGLIAANGAAVEDRVRAYLRDHSMPCPNCRYELRGNQTAACPECGFALTLENVPGAKKPSLIIKN